MGRLGSGCQCYLGEGTPVLLPEQVLNSPPIIFDVVRGVRLCCTGQRLCLHCGGGGAGRDACYRDEGAEARGRLWHG